MSEKKIAVVFPGMGYHTDKPLLYYSKRIARSMGYEIVELNSNSSEDILNNCSYISKDLLYFFKSYNTFASIN